MYQPTSDHDHAQAPYNQATATGVPVGYNSHTHNHNHNYNPPFPQPMPLLHTAINNKIDWSTGLFDCFSDFKNCCITCWCPCVTFGQIAEIVDRGSTSCGASGALYTLIAFVIGSGCLYSCFYRSKMRRQYMLKESPCWDWLVHCCCEPCALCQEYRELQNRGFDLVIGWHGNVEQRTPGVTMTPTAPPVVTMSR